VGLVRNGPSSGDLGPSFHRMPWGAWHPVAVTKLPGRHWFQVELGTGLFQPQWPNLIFAVA